MSDDRSCGKCIYFNSTIRSCEADSYCARDLDKARYNGFLEGKKQGRSDAIEELVDNLINPQNYEKKDFGNCLTDSDKANDFFEYVCDIAERLKKSRIS